MEGYRILSITTAFQVGTINEEVDRGVSPTRLHITAHSVELMCSLPFYQDKLHEEKVFQRFNEILTKVGPAYSH